MEDLAFRSCDPVTQDEFVEWLQSVSSADLHHYELLDGFILREPPAGWPHGEIEAEIVGRIVAYLGAHQLAGRAFGSSQGFDLPSGDTVEPDVAFVSAERWQTLARPVRGFPRVVPDLVVEILSPSTRSIDQVQKKRIYARNGVREYWLVDPEASSVQCFRRGRSRYGAGRMLTGSDVVRSTVLPGLEICVRDLFPDP